MKGKEKLIGSIVVVLLAIAAALGFNSDEFKEQVCKDYKPSPAPSIIPSVEK